MYGIELSVSPTSVVVLLLRPKDGGIAGGGVSTGGDVGDESGGKITVSSSSSNG